MMDIWVQVNISKEQLINMELIIFLKKLSNYVQQKKK